MLHPSTKKLIDRLSEMTLQRKIDWVSGDRADTMAYDTEGYRVLLEGNPAELILCDALGNELERADHVTMTATQNADGTSYDELIEAMRVEASRIARGAEDAIASVLGGLDLDGDGIPDVPTPIELEDAPDGPMAERLDDIEDTVDEMTGLDGQVTQDEVLPAANLEAVTPTEAPFVDVQDEPQLEETPNVGEAVANLAKQVNNTPASTTQDAKPPVTGGTLLKAGGLITSGVGFNALNNSHAENTIVESKTEPQDSTNETDDAPIDVEAPFEPSKPLNSVPRPGHILSLSGLAGDVPQFETNDSVDGDQIDVNKTVPSIAETISATPEIDTREEAVSDAPISVDAEPETAEPMQPEPVHHADEVAELEDISEVLTDSSPVAPSEPVADTTETDADADAGPQQPKRFNPWI